MFTNNKHIVNTYNLFVVIFVALGTLSTAYGLAVIGSTVGQPDCMLACIPYHGRTLMFTVVYAYFNLATESEPGYAHTSNMYVSSRRTCRPHRQCHGPAILPAVFGSDTGATL